jgi:multiple sugar transport system substrate-binding protein
VEFVGVDPLDEQQLTMQTLSRRRFVRVAGAMVLGGVGATLLAACGSGAQPAPTAAPAAQPTSAAAPAKPTAAAAAQPTTAPAAAAQPTAAATQAQAAGQTGPLPVAKKGSTISILLWSHFVPAYDDWLTQFGNDWGSKNGVTVKIDHVSTNDLPARIAAEASAGAGHDIIEFNGVVQTRTYSDKFVDVSDVADAVSKKYGGWIDMAKNVGTVDGQWKALLDYFIAQPNIYRKDYFDEVGASPPDDYMSLLDASRKLKANGHPCGQALSNCNDGNHNWRSVLYSFGATETSPDGATITINSPETLAALKYGVQLYNDGMTDEVFSWDNSGNNLLILSGRGSWIDNATSVYITAVNQNPDIAENLQIALNPKGPGDKGARKNVCDPNAWAIWKFSQNADTAKAFLAAWYDAWQDWGKVSSGYNSPPLNDMWKKPMPGLDQDPKLTIMQDWKDLAYVYGYQGPITGAMEEIQSTFVIPNMFARAARGDTPENALAWAEGEYKRIFAKYKLG